MSARRFQFTVDHMVGRRETELVVTYSVTPFVPATYWQPAEGGECEIVSVKHGGKEFDLTAEEEEDRKSTRLNSSHSRASRMPSSA